MSTEYDYLIKIIMLGDSSVGKTRFVSKYINDDTTEEFAATVGIDFKEKIKTINNITVKLQIWDTAGQERYRSLTTAFLRDAMAFLIVFDITNEKSFTNIQFWIEQIRDHAYCDKPDVIICGNKGDLVEQRVISDAQIALFVDMNKLYYLETSALTGHNIDSAFDYLLELVITRIEGVEFANNKIVHLQTDTDNNKCC